jgi:hypothetical protein
MTFCVDVKAVKTTVAVAVGGLIAGAVDGVIAGAVDGVIAGAVESVTEASTGAHGGPMNVAVLTCTLAAQSHQMYLGPGCDHPKAVLPWEPCRDLLNL